MFFLKAVRQHVNLLRFFMVYWQKKVALPYPPFFIWIEPTNICNLRCPVCPQSTSKFKSIEKGFMDLELFKKIINQVREIAPRAITMHLSGEPMLHRDIFNMIIYAKKAGLTILMATNGTLLNRENAEKLIDSRVDAVRIDFTPDPDAFEKIRVGAQWQSVYDNIKNLLELKIEKKSFLPAVGIINRSSNDPASFKLLQDLFSGLPVDEISPFEEHTWAGDFADASPEGGKGSWGEYYPCSHAWSSMAIRYNGQVVPCCRDLQGAYIVGNVNKSSLLEIWNSPALQKLRRCQKHQNLNSIPLCRSCSKLREGNHPLQLIKRHLATLRKKHQAQTGMNLKK